MYVHVNTGGQAAEPTPEEAALLRGLLPKDLSKEDLASALAARGVDPARAAELAGMVSTGSAGKRVAGFAVAWFWIGLAIAFGVGKRPLRRWLEAHFPGTESLVDWVVPVAFILAVMWMYLSRRRQAGDAPEGATRADQIENKPIG